MNTDSYRRRAAADRAAPKADAPATTIDDNLADSLAAIIKEEMNT